LKKKGKWDGDVDSTFAKLDVLSNESELASCGAPVLLEVIFEDLTLKCETYKRLGEIMPAETMFWTNTSCLDVERMGEASGRPERFLGTHGMNPVHLMKGVEVVRHPKLDQEVLDFTLSMLKRVNKDPFVTNNVPGFIVNNGLIPWMIHYTLMLERRQATTEDIDKALKSSLGHPQGVFLLTDFIGVNTTILVAEELYDATLDPRYIAPPLLYKMREAGWDGFKTGRGFYDWSDRKNPKPIPFEELTKPKE
jgi:3-hydroxybutyryl-CoA dehydrogenase